MNKKTWIERINWILLVIMGYVFITSPDWIFKDDVISVVFYSICILMGIASYILNRQMIRENEEREQ